MMYLETSNIINNTGWPSVGVGKYFLTQCLATQLAPALGLGESGQHWRTDHSCAHLPLELAGAVVTLVLVSVDQWRQGETSGSVLWPQWHWHHVLRPVTMWVIWDTSSVTTWHLDHETRTMASISKFIILVSKLFSLSVSDHQWSPIIGDNHLFPPLVPRPSLLIHSAPVYRGYSSDQSSDSGAKYRGHRRVSSYRIRDPYYRRNYRRRRRYHWRDPRSRSSYRRVRSHSYFSAQPSYQWPVSEPEVTRARSREETLTLSEDTSEGRGFVRSLFGAPEHCLENGRQFSCTFAPVCWMTGGIATSGKK